MLPLALAGLAGLGLALSGNPKRIHRKRGIRWSITRIAKAEAGGRRVSKAIYAKVAKDERMSLAQTRSLVGEINMYEPKRRKNPAWDRISAAGDTGYLRPCVGGVCIQSADGRGRRLGGKVFKTRTHAKAWARREGVRVVEEAHDWTVSTRLGRGLTRHHLRRSNPRKYTPKTTSQWDDLIRYAPSAKAAARLRKQKAAWVKKHPNFYQKMSARRWAVMASR